MKIVNQYLKSVKSWLPKENRDDIINELSENILSQIEAKEAELGRPLNQVETEAIVKRHGHPLMLAGQYYSDQDGFTFHRRIIGSTFFPLYRKVLSFNLLVGLMIIVLVMLIALLSGSFPFSLIDGMRVFLIQIVVQFTIVTGVFLWIESYLSKYPDRWHVSKPNDLDLEFSKRGVQIFEASVQIIAYLIFGIFFNAVVNHQHLILFPIVELTSIWQQVYLPIMFVIFAELLEAGIILIRPHWKRLQLLATVSSGVAALIALHLLLTTNRWFASENERLSDGINRQFFYGLVVAGAIVIGVLIWDIVRLVRYTTISNTEE